MRNSLYSRIAEKIASQIRSGAIPVGGRIPSVRQLSRQENVSISTVMAAYSRLEEQGWVEVRPKSGYYVRRRAYRPMAVPNATEVLSRPIIATTSQLVMNVQRDGSKPHAISFSRATPALDFPIIRRMQQTYTRHADWGSGYQNESLTQKEKNKIIISDK